MARTGDQPGFGQAAAIRRHKAVAGISASGAVGDRLACAASRHAMLRLPGDGRSVVHMHGRIRRAVKYDGRHLVPRGLAGGAAAHRGQRLGHGLRHAGRQARMHTYRCEQVGPGLCQQHRRCTTRRQAGHIDPRRIGGFGGQHLPRQAGKDRQFATVTALVLGAEPVPAAVHVGSGRLCRIDHDHALSRGPRVHPGAGGEVLWRLGAAVQHDHHGAGRVRQRLWAKQQVVPRPRRPAVMM